MSSLDHALPGLSAQRLRAPPLVPTLVFLILVPVLMGMLLGATRSGLAQHLPWLLGVAFWVLASLAVWICLYGATYVASWLLRPWRSPLWLALTLGAIAGSVPARYFVYGAAELFRDQLTAGRVPRSAPPFEWTPEFLLGYLQGWAGVYLSWIAVGLICHRLFGVPHFATALRQPATTASDHLIPDLDRAAASPAPSIAVAAPPVALFARLPGKIGAHVLALEAEDHYVRVHTDLGSTLILARLSDAIAELGRIDGVRVHRSYWVRKGAVTRVFTQGKGLRLRLVNGLDVPVSQAYKELARSSGLLGA
jgi:hypothetical protein